MLLYPVFYSLTLRQNIPKKLVIQLANTWPKITAHELYAIVTNRKECKTPRFSSVAATVEKANTYVFAGRLIRNAEVRGSIPLCSTNRINDVGQGSNPAFFICHRFITWPNHCPLQRIPEKSCDPY